MRTPLQILIVDDSKDDAELIVASLERDGFAPVFERVDTAAGLSAALNQKSWDVVVSDYRMPSFSGADALKLLQDSGRDIPFISVSGMLGENQAVEMMKAGAHDYLIKDNLTRLASSIARELKAARARNEQKRTREVAAYLAAVVESSDDAIISMNLDGIVMSWNKASEHIYGYTAGQMIGRSISELLPANRREEARDILRRLRNGERIPRFDTVHVRKNNTSAEVSLTVSPIRASGGEIIGASVIARDVSERRREEAERLLLIKELSEALANSKTLQGLLPICAACKRVRDDRGYWQQVEVYVRQHSEVEFTHSICPDCRTRLYPGFGGTQNSAAPPQAGEKGPPSGDNLQV